MKQNTHHVSELRQVLCSYSEAVAWYDVLWCIMISSSSWWEWSVNWMSSSSDSVTLSRNVPEMHKDRKTHWQRTSSCDFRNLTCFVLCLVELSSEDEDEAEEDLNSEYTESVDEEETKLRVQSMANTKVSKWFDLIELWKLWVQVLMF